MLELKRRRVFAKVYLRCASFGCVVAINNYVNAANWQCSRAKSQVAATLSANNELTCSADKRCLFACAIFAFIKLCVICCVLGSIVLVSCGFAARAASIFAKLS